MRQRETVLVYQIGSLGDTIVSIPALKAIRRHFGAGAHIALMHENRQDSSITSPAEVLDGLGLVNEFINYKVFDHGARKWLHVMKVAASLWAKRFRSVVYLVASDRPATSVRRDSAFFGLCGIRNRIGFFAFPPQTIHPTDSVGLPASVPHECWFRLERLRREGIDVSVESDLTKPFLSLPVQYVGEARSWLASCRQSPSLPLVAICPGSKQPANTWPIERFIEIGRRLIQQRRAEILVVGGPLEREAGEGMVEAWGRGLNAAGYFSPLASAALLAECSFMIGLDTGTTHLAAAQGIPCVGLYGCREEPGRFYPLGEGHVVLRHPVPCAGCRVIEKPCPVVGHPCMTGITVDMVWAAINSGGFA